MKKLVLLTIALLLVTLPAVAVTTQESPDLFAELFAQIKGFFGDIVSLFGGEVEQAGPSPIPNGGGGEQIGPSVLPNGAGGEQMGPTVLPSGGGGEQMGPIVLPNG